MEQPESLEKRIAKAVKEMIVECEHGGVEPVDLVEQLNELVADCHEDVKAGKLTDAARDRIIRLIEREANRINVNLLDPAQL